MYKCKKCGKEWIPRKDNPKNCPDPTCRTELWNTYVKKEVKMITSENVLFRVSLGELMLIMSYITVNHKKKYAKYLDITEQALGNRMKILESEGLLIEKSKNPLLDRLKVEDLSKKYLIKKINNKIDAEIERIKNTEQARILYDNFETKKGKKFKKEDFEKDDKLSEKIQKDKNLTKRLKKEGITEENLFENYKQKLLSNIEEIRKEKIEMVDFMFEDGKFGDFLKLYFLLFYPKIKIPLIEVIDYYYEWGDKLK